MSNEFDSDKFAVWCIILLGCIIFWAGVALLVDWIF